MKVEHIPHFEKRMKQRGLSKGAMSLIFKYGKEYYRAGGVFIVLHVKSLPPRMRNLEFVKKASRWALFLSDDGSLVTCYARKDVMKYIKKKPKRDLRGRF